MNANTIDNANTNAAEQITINLDDDIKIIDGKVMQKQARTKKAIKKAGEVQGKNQKPEKDDECYTDYNDIVDELHHWGRMGKLRGKNIICPCDWDISKDSDIYQIRFEFKDGITSLEFNNQISVFDWVKSVSFTKGTGERIVWTDDTIGRKEVHNFFMNKLKCNFVRVLFCKSAEYGIKSITASGYNPDIDKGIKFQDIDYSKYDVCITNPPFSLYKEFLGCIVGKIDFCVLAPFNNRNTVFESMPMFFNQLYLGYGRQIHLYFANPTEENHYKPKMVCCDWLVSWPEAQEEVNSKNNKSGIPYELYKDDFGVLENMLMKDGTCPIITSGKKIPDDYDGWMFVKSTALDWINTSEYEIYCTQLSKLFNTDHPELSPFAVKLNGKAHKHNGHKLYASFVIRKKQR